MKQDQRGAAIPEFALLLPIYIILLLMFFELGFVNLSQASLASASDGIARYLRDQKINNDTPTIAGVRNAACSAQKLISISCDAAMMKIALYDSTNPVSNPIAPPMLIENAAPSTLANDSYVVALGYEWNSPWPTAKLILPHVGDRTQIQTFTYALLAERPMD